MPVLKAQTKREDVKLLGANVPLRLHNYITFYCLAKRKTKSDILLEILFKWMSERKEIEPDIDLINDIVKRLNIEWKIEKASGKGLTMSEFKETVRKELFTRGLVEEHINVILSKVSK
jgi:hypothetical protein